MKSYLSKLGVLLFGAMFAVAACQDYDEEIRKVNDKLTADKAELTEITEELDKAIAALEEKHDADLAKVNADLKGLADELAAAEKALEEAYKAADEAVRADFAKADEAVKADLEAKIKKAVDDATAAVEGLKQTLEAADANLKKEVLAYVDGKVEALEAEIADLKNADLKNAEEIAKVAADLAKTQSDLAAAKTAFETAINELKNKVAKNASDIENLRKDLAAAKEELQGAIDLEAEAREKGDKDALDAAKAYSDEKLKAAVATLTATHEADIKAVMDTIEVTKAALQAAITAEENARKTTDANLQTAIDAEKTAREAKDIDLANDIAALTSALNEYKTKTDGEIAALKTADAAINTRIDNVEKALADFKTYADKIYATKDDLSAEKVRLNELYQHVTDIKHDVANELQGVLATIETLKNTLAGLAIDVEALMGRIQSLVFAPDYLHGYATLQYAKIAKPAEEGANQVEYEYIPRVSVLRYKVNAKDAAAEADALAKAWAANSELLSYTLEQVETRAAVENKEELEIVEVTNDGEYLLVKVLANNFVDAFYEGDDVAYSASLRAVSTVENGDDLATEYAGLIPAENPLQIGVGLTKDGVLVEKADTTLKVAVNDTVTTLDVLKGVSAALVKFDEEKSAWALLSEDELKEFDLPVEFKEETTYTEKVTKDNFAVEAVDGRTNTVRLAKKLNREYVGQKMTVVQTYTCNSASVTATCVIELTAEQIKAVFAPQVIDWNLALAKELRATDGTAYANKIVRKDVKYTKVDGSEFPYNLYTILQNTTDFKIQKTVKLNGEVVTDVFQAGSWAYPACTAELRLTSYAFPEAGAEPNVYEVLWIAESSDLYLEATGSITLNPLPAKVEVVDTVKVTLPKGYTTFSGKTPLIAAAYEKFGAEKAAFGEGAKVNDLMLAELLDNPIKVENNPTNEGAIQFDVDDNVDNSFVRIYNSYYKQGKFELSRVITTWFGVVFDFKVIAEPELPANKLIPADDYMVADTVTVFGKINEQGVYTINLADLGKYLEVGEEINNNLAVKFEVVKGDVVISTTDPVAVLPLDAPVKGAYGVLEADKAIVDWADWAETTADIKATLIAEGAYTINEKTFTLKTEDPLSFDYGDKEVIVTRLPGQTTIAKVYQDLVVKSIAEPSVANLADPNASSIKDIFNLSGADHTYSIDSTEVSLYGVYTTDPRTTALNDLIPYNKEKWSFDAENGTVTLNADDGNLLYPIYAKVNLKFVHNIHGNCESSSDIVVVFDPSADARDMMNKFTNGGEITLKENLILSAPIVIDNPRAEVVLDLNGKTIQNIARTPNDFQAAIIVKRGKLIIKGEGTVDGGSGSAGNIAVWAGRGDASNNGEVYIYGGKFINGADATGNGSEVIYANNAGKVFIYGGEFEAGERCTDMSNQYSVLNCKDNDYKAGRKADIVVKGGKFINFNPADNVSEGPGTNFVDPAFTSELAPNSSTDYIVK